MIFRKTLSKLITQLPSIQIKNYSDLKSALTKAEVIPDVFCNPPKYKACVDYKDASVNLGNDIAPQCTECEPKVSWEKPCGNFVLIMLNPDMESRECPELRHFVHWLVGNIKDKDISSGQTLMEYIGACPAEGTGCHRIVFLVYAQQEKIDDFCIEKICKDTPCGREKFNLKGFTEKFKLCDPYAANFFQTQSDCFSQELRKKLTEKSNKK